MKVALVHDWLTGMRGGERVLERLCALFPDAPIYTLLWNRGSVSPAIESHPIHVSPIQRLPRAARLYRWYLPLFPRAIATLRPRGFDAVISSSHCVAKGVPVERGTFHLSYIHTPMRYVWELEELYFPPGRFAPPIQAYVRHTCASLRAWDVATSRGPHVMVANSRHVAARIAAHYGRTAEVIPPPVRVGPEPPAARSRPGDFYLLAGAFAPYKRADLAVAACLRLGRRLVVMGAGQEEKRLRRLSQPGIEWLGRVDDARLAELYRDARALIFPGEEDFGIMPVEAMANGCPVIALGRGGALETVGREASAAAAAEVARGGVAAVPAGVLFGTQSVEALCAAIETFERRTFDPATLHAAARPFAVERFDRDIAERFDRAYAAWKDGSLEAASPGPARSYS